MSNILLIIITVIGIAVLLGIFIRIHSFIKGIYLKVALISHNLTHAASWYFDAFLNETAKLRDKIFKPRSEGRLSDFGGLGRLIIMVILLALSVIMGIAVFTDTSDINELFLEFGLKAPPMFLMSIIINIDDFTIFNFADMVQAAIVGAIPIAFFRRDKESDMNGVVRYVYSAIFAAFFFLISYFVPSEIFMFPTGILFIFTEMFGFLSNLITSFPLGIAGILISAVILALYLAVLFVSLYGIFCLFVVTIKEFIASILVSLIPTVILFLVVLVLDGIFPVLSTKVGGILVLIGLIIVLMLVSNFIRNLMEEDADYDANNADYSREKKLERRAASRAIKRARRAARRGKTVYTPEIWTGYAPFPTRVCRSVKYFLTEAYSRNA